MARILITGASDGLGRALAYDLAEAGHRLILHGRDAARFVDPDLAGVTGRYFDRERESRALPQAYDPGFRDRLRQLTESLLASAAEPIS